MVDSTNPPPREAVQMERRSRWHFIRFLKFLPLLLIVVYFCIPIVAIPLDVYNSHRERQRLLHETDHYALLAASRKLMKEHAGEHIAEPDQTPVCPASYVNLVQAICRSRLTNSEWNYTAGSITTDSSHCRMMRVTKTDRTH